MIDKHEPVIEVTLDRTAARIGVTSDTHIPTRARALPGKLFSLLQDVQLILHAGDLVDECVLDDLQSLAPVEAVAGNMDPAVLRQKLGRQKLICSGRIKIGLVHGDGSGHTARQRALAAFSSFKPQVIVFGHSHQPLCEYAEGILLFNPGSAVDPRRARRGSCGLLLIEDARVRGEIFYL